MGNWMTSITKGSMPLGTKSLLFGVHCWFIHPWFVAAAWYKLYGFPSDPRLWIAFLIHDWGYWGKPDMDGKKGETHSEFAGKLMDYFFGKKWGDFCRYHSRYWAKKNNKQYSRLCVADKLAIVLTPAILYLPLANFSGEIQEYMEGKAARTPGHGVSQKEWLRTVKGYVGAWVEEHKDEKEDSWTGCRDVNLCGDPDEN
jgi:hypothetical protein